MEGREDNAWLLRNRFNPFPISGSLALADGVLTFTLDEDAANATLGWLEDLLESEGIAEKIEAGETIVAFAELLADCEISWPLTGGGATMVIDSPSRKWVITHDHPVGGAMLQTLNLISGRGKARAWKKALAAAEAPPAERE